MPCFHPIVGSPGQTFRFRITDAQNVLACVGRLRTTGPQTGNTDSFTFGQLQNGISWPLVDDMSYDLRIIIQPQDSAQTSQITAQTSAGNASCSRDGAGQIAEWTIDVL